MTTPIAPTLQRAVVSLSTELAQHVSQYIPDHTSLLAIQDILTSCAQVGKYYIFQELIIRPELEEISDSLTLPEKLLLAFVPCGKDRMVQEVLVDYLKTYHDGVVVPFKEPLKRAGLLEYLDKANDLIVYAKKTFESPPTLLFDTTLPIQASESLESESESRISESEVTGPVATESVATESEPGRKNRLRRNELAKSARSLMISLELIYRCIASYIWLSYRLMAFDQFAQAVALREEVLSVMQTLLNIIAAELGNTATLEPTERPKEPYTFTQDKEGSRHTFVSISGLFDSDESIQSEQEPELL